MTAEFYASCLQHASFLMASFMSNSENVQLLFKYTLFSTIESRKVTS